MSDTGGSDETFLTTAQVKFRYGGRSNMWIWRRLHDDPDFPRPFIMGNQRYWRLSELIAWEEMRRPPHAATS